MIRGLVAGLGLVALLNCGRAGVLVEFGPDQTNVNNCAVTARSELRKELDKSDLRVYCREFVSRTLDRMNGCLAEGGEEDSSYKCSHADIYTGFNLSLDEATARCIDGMGLNPHNELYNMGGNCVGRVYR